MWKLLPLGPPSFDLSADDDVARLRLSELCGGIMVNRRQLPAGGLVSQHGQCRVGEIPEDVHRLPLQQQGLLHKLLLGLHQQLDGLSQYLQGLGHRGQEHPAGPLLLEALSGHLRHVVVGPAGGRPGRKGVGQAGAGGTIGWRARGGGSRRVRV